MTLSREFDPYASHGLFSAGVSLGPQYGEAMPGPTGAQGPTGPPGLSSQNTNGVKVPTLLPEVAENGTIFMSATDGWLTYKTNIGELMKIV